MTKQWVNAKDKLDPVAALNFVSTADIGGGDYGSPVVNPAGELVGVTFDGNLESLPEVFLYTDEQARRRACCDAGHHRSVDRCV